MLTKLSRRSFLSYQILFRNIREDRRRVPAVVSGVNPFSLSHDWRAVDSLQETLVHPRPHFRDLEDCCGTPISRSRGLVA